VSWFDIADDQVLRAHVAAGTGSSQTPQAYSTALLRDVTALAVREHWHAQSTVQLLLQAGHAVAAVPGERLSIKLTTPEDWILAQALHDLLQR
jgi:2-C-methyl-D-erythritol 4-phosphate cytidylyltransferase